MSSNNNQNATEKNNLCATELKTTSEKFVWKIDSFSKRPEKCGECLKSSEFISSAPNGQELKWQLKMYPNACKEEFKDYVSIFLYLIGPKNREVKAKYQISIIKSDGDKFVVKQLSEYHKFGKSNTGSGKGFHKLIKREDLLNKENGYFDGDRLTIEYKLIIQQQKSDIKVPKCRALEDMSNLFEKSLFPDCKIISGDDKKYEVHKCILGCRSPVFGAMFEHDMTEKNNNEISISEMKGNAIEQMLRFIYSGKEPDLEKEEMAEDLLIGADKYELPRLKLLCERKLINSLESANACRLLVLANRYSAKHLKNHAIDFIKMNVNEVMESEEWKELADKEVMEQILKAIMVKQI